MKEIKEFSILSGKMVLVVNKINRKRGVLL
jgi:hypothetical protein